MWFSCSINVVFFLSFLLTLIYACLLEAPMLSLEGSFTSSYFPWVSQKEDVCAVWCKIIFVLSLSPCLPPTLCLFPGESKKIVPLNIPSSCQELIHITPLMHICYKLGTMEELPHYVNSNLWKKAYNYLFAYNFLGALNWGFGNNLFLLIQCVNCLLKSPKMEQLYDHFDPNY